MNTHTQTMMVVEDNQQTIRLFEDMFRNSDVNLVYVSSSHLRDLGALIAFHQPTMIVMDYMSIVYDYDEVINIVPLHIPTVILSSVEENKFATNFDYVIKKPFAPSQLYRVVDRITRHAI